MVTERLRRVLDIITSLPPEEQDRVAAAIQAVLDEPATTSDEARPDVMAAFEQVMEHSARALEYLRDR